MNLSIHPETTGMLVVEMQNDLVHPSRAGGHGLTGALARAVRDRGVLERLAGVLDACRGAGVLVLYATKERHPSLAQPSFPPIYATAGSEPILVAGTWGAQVVERISPAPGDIVLPRFTSIDPSVGSELWSVVRRCGLDTLIVAGVSTTLAVEGTVRAAANRGIRAVVVEDCCASVPDSWHEFSVRNVLPLLAEVVVAEDVPAALGG